MPALVRRFLKTAVGFLLVGVGLGVYMLVRRELWGEWPGPWWISAHTHVILVGFVILMIFGVALWMFPRPAKDEAPFDPRFAEAAYWLITLGTAARVAGELARAHTDVAAVRWTVVGGGGAQALGVALFFWAMWGRIRGRREESA
jgi:heme/copper-type cytochrome/quinol oxidase subunit 1